MFDRRTGAHLFIRVTDDGDGMIASGDCAGLGGLRNMRYRGAVMRGPDYVVARDEATVARVVEVQVPMKRF